MIFILYIILEEYQVSGQKNLIIKIDIRNGMSEISLKRCKSIPAFGGLGCFLELKVKSQKT